MDLSVEFRQWQVNNTAKRMSVKLRGGEANFSFVGSCRCGIEPLQNMLKLHRLALLWPKMSKG